MSVLEKNLEIFFNNNNFNKNKEFKAFFYQDDEINNFKVIYDDKNYIHYLINIPKEKEYIIKEKIEYEVLITDSSFDILFHKNSSNNICCILILIINDIEFKITNENYLDFKIEQFQNMNDQLNIINKTKQKIINHIKEQKEKLDSINIESLLLEGKEINLLFNKDLINNEHIKKLTSIISKVEIKIDNLNNENINDSCFMNIYEILSPSYKSMLSQKYFNEIPNNLYDLMIKYQNIYITKDLFNQYKKIKISKNNIINIDKKENHNQNKNKKIIFHLDKNKNNYFKKKRFRIIFKKIKIENGKKIEPKLKKNIFKIDNIDDKDKNIQKGDKMNIENNCTIGNISKNKINIFKCVYPNVNNVKKYPFFINKKYI